MSKPIRRHSQHREQATSVTRCGLGSLALLGLSLCASPALAQEDTKLPYDVHDVFTRFTARSMSLYEGESTQKHVVMSINTERRNQPTDPVTIRAYVSDPTQATLKRRVTGESSTKVEMVFTTRGVPNDFYVLGLDDALADGDRDIEVRFEPTESADPRFNGVQLDPIKLRNIDNEPHDALKDDPVFEVIADRHSVEEGDPHRLGLTLRLKHCPPWFGTWVQPRLKDPTRARIIRGGELHYVSPANWERDIELEIEAINTPSADGDRKIEIELGGLMATWADPAQQCDVSAPVKWHQPSNISFTVYDNEHPGEPEPRATVLKHGWDIPNMHFLGQAIEEVAASPFDGIFFLAGKASHAFQSNLIEQSTMEEELAPLLDMDFGTTQQNYLTVKIASIEGGLSGVGVPRLVENFRRLGKAITNLGLAGRPIEGIAFDHEVYNRGNPWDLPGACTSDITRDECADYAFKAGKAMMEALVEGWPTVRFLPLYGFWVHDPGTYAQLRDYSPHPDATQDFDMYGYFAAGVFAATMDTPAQYIDGGELYYLRTASQYERTYRWITGEMVDNSPFLPDAYKKAYKEQSLQAFGLYDDRYRHWDRAAEATPTVWEFLVDTAKRHADVIWLYTERHDWWPSDSNNWPASGEVNGITGMEGPVSKTWFDATKRAIEVH